MSSKCPVCQQNALYVSSEQTKSASCIQCTNKTRNPKVKQQTKSKVKNIQVTRVYSFSMRCPSRSLLPAQGMPLSLGYLKSINHFIQFALQHQGWRIKLKDEGDQSLPPICIAASRVALHCINKKFQIFDFEPHYLYVCLFSSHSAGIAYLKESHSRYQEQEH